MGAKKSKPATKPSPTAPSADSTTIPPPAVPSPVKKRVSIDTKLAKKTRYTVEDVRSLHEKFSVVAAQSQPVNRITREQFRDVLADHSVSWRTDVFCARLFDYFDQRVDGTINFGEFVRGLALASSGDPRDKLKLSFDVFDVEGTGTIARWEMRQVLEGIFVSGKQFETDDHAKEGKEEKEKHSIQIETFVNDVFTSYDKDKSGQLSFMEYMQASMKYPKLTDFMNGAENFCDSTSSASSTSNTTATSEVEKLLRSLESHNEEQARRVASIEQMIQMSSSTTSHVRPHHDDHHVTITRDQILNLKTTFDRLSKETIESPNEIEKQQFKDVLDEFQISWKNDDYLNRLFDVVDTHGSNTINYQECLVGLSMLMNGNPQERLTLSFELFDVDGTGTISKQEMLTVLRAADKNATSDMETAKFVEKIFHRSDKNHSGTLTLREFSNACMKFEDLQLMRK